MKIFELQTKLTSYTYPIIKILLSIAFLLLLLFRNNIFGIPRGAWNFFVSLVCVCAGIMCILIIYISMCEVFQTFSNREISRAALHADISKCRTVLAESIIRYAEQQDITEIIIIRSNEVLKIGSSAENKYSSAIFENKRYYIGDTEYNTLNEWTEALKLYTANNMLHVLSIDGVASNRIKSCIFNTQ